MKNNIIYLYIVYILVLYLLCIIDITTLMYYIYWVSNIFVYPLLWLWIKIMYYNRTILLLLLFYYFIAKFTIKELGYRYIYFFKIDIKKWRSIYLNYIWSITTYHIEMVSIFLFFFVIMIPIYIYNKQIIILIGFFLIFLIAWLRVIKNRFKFIMEGKKSNIRDFFIFFLIFFFSLKILNYYNIKGIMTTYIHLDKWVFELLEWKIQMYEKLMEKDYYSETVGLKPHWIGQKIKFEDEYNKKIFNKGDFLSKKKRKFSQICWL